MESVLPPLPIEPSLSLPSFFISRVPASLLRPRLRWFGVGRQRINNSREFCVPPLHFVRCCQLLTVPLPLEPFELQITVALPLPSMPGVALLPSNSSPPVEFNAPPSFGVDFYSSSTSIAYSTPKLDNLIISNAVGVTVDDATSIDVAAALRLLKSRRRMLKCGRFPPRRVFL